MINYISYENIDKKKWDTCIANSRCSLMYAQSWYLDAVCEKWNALILDDYAAVMPVAVNSKMGIQYVFMPPFVQKLGIFSPEKTNEKLTEDFLEVLTSKIKFIHYNFHYQAGFNAFQTNIHYNQNYELKLSETYQNLVSKFSVNTKRNIQKALKNNLSLSNNCSLQQIITLFQNDKAKQLSSFKKSSLSTLKKLYRNVPGDSKKILLGAFNQQNQLIAGCFLIQYQNKITFLFSGNSQEGKKNGAMFLLINQLIKENAENNYILDFEGSNHEGLAKFYKSFGAVNIPYTSFRYNNLPLPIRWIKK